MWKEIQHLLWKEITLELRNKQSINGLLLYLGSSIFICYMSFQVKAGSLNPITWNTLFWIIVLFNAIQSSTKSFIGERKERWIYLYALAHPLAILWSKMLYQILLLLLMGWIGLVIYALFLGNPVQDLPLYGLILSLGCVGLACSLTFLSAIVSKSGEQITLMSILSFPLLLPLLLVIIKASKNAMDGLEWETVYDELGILVGLNMISISLSYVLFPYLWKS